MIDLIYKIFIKFIVTLKIHISKSHQKVFIFKKREKNIYINVYRHINIIL